MTHAAALPQRDAPAGDVPILRIDNLMTHFVIDEDTVVRAVNGVSLRVGRGETLAVVGESGSGKSVTGLTTMRLLMRTPARIAGGNIWFSRKDGTIVDLLTLPEAEMRKLRGGEIAMIFQDPMSSLNPVFSVGEQIAEGLRIHQALGRAQARARTIELLGMVGIADPGTRVDEYPHQLSGGMRQRVMIAMAIACNPRLLIADEPTTALDVTIQAQIVELLRDLQQKTQMAMIFVTHDLNLVAEFADRVAVMYCGQVLEEGPVAQVLHTPRHPYTKALLECIPEGVAGTGSAAVRPIPGKIANPLDPPEGCKFNPRCGLVEPACRAAEIALQDTGNGHTSRCRRWQDVA